MVVYPSLKPSSKTCSIIGHFSFHFISPAINMANNNNKPITKSFATFQKWNCVQIACETSMINDVKTVVKIWCKLCAKYKDDIMNDPSVQGAVKK